jgi:predicted HicB family RNase H-like nuclease
MSNYTKVTMKKEVYELAKIQAVLEGRSVMNYVEQLIVKAVNDKL